MPLENPQFISDLVKTNPANSDNAGQGAAHLRILKDALLKSFPQIAGEVELSHEAINQLPARHHRYGGGKGRTRPSWILPARIRITRAMWITT